MKQTLLSMAFPTYLGLRLFLLIRRQLLFRDTPEGNVGPPEPVHPPHFVVAARLSSCRSRGLIGSGWLLHQRGRAFKTIWIMETCSKATYQIHFKRCHKSSKLKQPHEFLIFYQTPVGRLRLRLFVVVDPCPLHTAYPCS